MSLIGFVGLSGCVLISASETTRTPQPTNASPESIDANNGAIQETQLNQSSTSQSEPLAPSQIEQLPASPSESDIEHNSLTDEDPSDLDKSSLEWALSEYLSDSGYEIERTDFYVDTADLNRDGVQDALVLLSGSQWCGTGGCRLVIFEGIDGEGYQVVSSMTLIHAPVSVSETTTNGWHDLIVTIRGGGIPSTDVALQFNGTGYPSNPTTEGVVLTESPNQTTLFGPNEFRTVIPVLDDSTPVPMSDDAGPQSLCGHWNHVASYETQNYWIYICQADVEGLVYTAVETDTPSNWIRLTNIERDGSTYRANNQDTTYVINRNALMIIQNGVAIATEPVQAVYEW
ncbi:MAG: hypothetical protein AAFU78_10450 [Cyanobacteria bacterium J06633_2]